METIHRKPEKTITNQGIRSKKNMTTLKELLNKFNTNIKLEDNILNYNIENPFGTKIESFQEYTEETRNNTKIHVFKGTIDDNTHFEIIINPENKEENNQVTITYLGYPDDNTEEAETYKELVFTDEDIEIKEM